MSVLSPNMSLIIPTIGVDSGLIWEQSVNANSLTTDQHNHSPGSGVQIDPTGMNINADLTFNSFNATTLRSIRFLAQGSTLSGASDLGCLYVAGVDLYFNDVNGNQVRMTSGGTVNATSSGITNGTATASFVGPTLVVNAAVNTPANIQGASLLIGNPGTVNSKYVTLSAPLALASNYQLFLPLLPSSLSFVALDNVGNISSTIPVAAGITGTNITNNVNLPGNTVKENGKNVIVSSTNASTSSLAIIRGSCLGNAAIVTGEGFTASILGTGAYQVIFNIPFLDTPVVVASAMTGGDAVAVTFVDPSAIMIAIKTLAAPNDPANGAFSFIAIGQRS